MCAVCFVHYDSEEHPKNGLWHRKTDVYVLRTHTHACRAPKRMGKYRKKTRNQKHEITTHERRTSIEEKEAAAAAWLFIFYYRLIFRFSFLHSRRAKTKKAYGHWHSRTHFSDRVRLHRGDNRETIKWSPRVSDKCRVQSLQFRPEQAQRTNHKVDGWIVFFVLISSRLFFCRSCCCCCQKPKGFSAISAFNSAPSHTRVWMAYQTE